MDDDQWAAVAIQAAVILLLAEMRFRLRKPDKEGQYWKPWNGGGRGYMILWMVFQVYAGVPLLLGYILVGWIGLIAVFIAWIALTWFLANPDRMEDYS